MRNRKEQREVQDLWTGDRVNIEQLKQCVNFHTEYRAEENTDEVQKRTARTDEKAAGTSRRREEICPDKE